MNKTIRYLLPFLALISAYLMIILNGYTQDFPPPNGPILNFESFFGFSLLIIFCIPLIIIAYIYIFICRKISSNKITSLTIIILTIDFFANLLLFIKITIPESWKWLSYIYSVTMSDIYFLPLLFMCMLYFVRHNNIKYLSYTAYILGVLFVIGTLVAGILDIEPNKHFLMNRIYDLFMIFTYTMCYLLCNLKFGSFPFIMNMFLIFIAGIILELFTPFDFILVIQIAIAVIMFATKWIINRSIIKSKKINLPI